MYYRLLFVLGLSICFSNYARENPQTKFRVAVICHILHQGQSIGTSPNISAAQVRSQFIVLNQDFNRQNPDTTNTPAIFRARAASMDIHFAPATIDTNYQILPEPGIHRIQVPLATYKRSQIDSIKNLHAWNPEKYLNIWIVTLDDTLTGGYANYPTGSSLADLPSGSLPNPKSDGLTIQPKFFGSNYTSEGHRFDLKTPYERGRTATHEIGHWLGLKHIWGDGDCSVDDGVADTPLAARANLGDCATTPNSCGAGTPGDLPDMIQNYMDYSWPTCKNLFTHGQRTRVHTVLNQAPRRKTLAKYFRSVTDTGLGRDSLALVELYNSTNGANWTTSWDLSQALNTWYGLTITDGRVTALNLKSNNLSGAISARLTNLDSLASLNLEGNQITRLADLSAMAKLTSLDVSDNYLALADLKSNLSKLGQLANYSPQIVRTGKFYQLNQGQNLTLRVAIPRIRHTYRWFHHNQILRTEVSPTLTLTNIQAEDTGLYHCRIEVNDDDVADLVLLSRPDTVNLNLIPTDLHLSNSRLPENQAIGSMIGQFSTITADADSLHTYRISGDDASKFTLAGDTLKSAAVFDYESEKLYTLTVVTTDTGGLSLSKNFNIQIANVNELPLDLTLSDTSIAENSPIGTLIGKLNTRDTDTRDVHVYTLTGGDLQPFSIFTNRLEVANPLDFETRQTYHITITTQDWGGLSHSKNFTIKVKDVNEAPQELTLSNRIISENKPIGTTIGRLSSRDEDRGERHTYTLTGLDSAACSIAGADLKSKQVFDFETKSKYEIEITTTDRGGLTKTDTFDLQIDNVIEYTEGNRLRDSLALVALYDNTAGPNWVHTWNLNRPLETWYGVNTVDGRVVTLKLSSNNLVGRLPQNLKDLPTLSVLDLSHNKLSGLVDFSTSRIDTFKVGFNRFTFQDLKPNLGLFHDSSNYSPQAKFGLAQTYYRSDTQAVTMFADLSDPANQYQWYHHDTLLIGETDDTLHFDEVFFNRHNGPYYCKVTNPTVPNLTLFSELQEVVIEHQILESDSLALVALYDSAGGSNWKQKWNLSDPVHTWAGVTVLGSRVTRLELPNNNLRGPMPDEMRNLLALKTLNVSYNYLNRLILPTIYTKGYSTCSGCITYYYYYNRPVISHDNLDIKHNYFDFEDIKRYFHCYCFVSLNYRIVDNGTYNMYYKTDSYIPQLQPLRQGQYYKKFTHRDNSLSLNIGQSNYQHFQGDYFRWYQNNLEKRGEHNHTLIKSNLQPEDEGIYQIKIRNTTYSQSRSRSHSQWVPTGVTDHYSTIPLILSTAPDTVVVETLVREEYEALIDLYKKTDGDNWTNSWDTLMTGSHKWYGVQLTPSGRHVQGLRLEGNNLKDSIPASLLQLDSLKVLHLQHNKLTYLADLSGLDSLQDFKVQDNYLHFDHIYSNLSRFTDSSFYSPQKLLGGKYYSTFVGDTLRLTTKLNQPSYSYKWFHHDTLALSHGDDTLALNNIQVEDAGLYRCEVTSPTVPGLIIRSGFDTLTIQTVIESDSLALVALYDSTAGPNWRTKWDLSRPANTWYGLTIRRGRVLEIKLNNNKLRGFIPTAIDTLNLATFEVEGNALEGLNLPNLRAGSKLKLRHNNLDFGDLKPYLAQFDSVEVYTPQNLVRQGQLYERTMDDSVTLTVDEVSGAANRYQWFLDNRPLAGATAANLVVRNIQIAQTGRYHCRITNPYLPALVLESGKDTLTIAPRQIDSLALVALHTQAQGANWKNKWNLAQPLTTWYGLKISAGRVVEIDLAANNLSGRVPENLKYLDRLTKLHLQNNWLDSLDSLELPSGLDFQIQNNRLAPADLRPNLSLFRDTAHYSPQIIRAGSFYKQALGSHFELTVQVAEAAPSYQWFLEQAPLAGETAARFSLDSIVLLDIGTYHCEVTHPAIPHLKRRSLPDTLTISQRSIDSLALVALYRATDGLNWRVNWNLNQPIHTWYGVRMKDARVHELRLFSNQLKGNLAPEIGYLEKLTILEISDNALTGPIPATLGRLQHLHTLNLFDNQFSGTLPAELGNLENLMTLDIADNDLSGNLPASLGNLKSLTTLYFMNNRFSGPIPPEIGQLIHLLRVDGENNELTGTIPPEIGNLIHLETLYLCNNRLTGAIPPEVGRLTNLQILYLCDNDLSDSIPAELGDLIELVKLNLAGNNLEGALPESVSNLKELTHLWLQDNGLDSIPDLTGLTSLVSIKIKNNRLDFEDVARVISETGLTPDAGDDLEMSIRPGKHYIRPYNGLLLLTVNIRGAGNIYQWFHNKAPLLGETSSTLLVRDIQVADTGLYHCEVTNAKVSDMTLASLPDTLHILPLSLDSLYLVALQDSLGKPLWDLSQPIRTWSKIQIKDGRVTGLNLENINFKSQILKVINHLDALDSLDLSGNGFEFSPVVSHFKHLKFLDLSNNALRQLDLSISRLDSLETLWVFDNKLLVLPDFSHLTRLQDLKVQTNYLGFEDIRLNLGVLNHAPNNYSPQFIEFSGRFHRRPPASSLTLEVDVPAAQLYQWFHNSTALLNERAKIFNRSGLEFRDAGIYRCDITHPAVPLLTLQTFDTLVVTGTVIESDSLALVSFYNYTSGGAWKRPWKLHEPIHKWPGVLTDKGRVSELKLNNNGLIGIIPETSLQLDSLKVLEVSFNTLYDLPDLSTTKLVKLEVHNNYLDFVSLKPNVKLFHSSSEYSPQKFVANGQVYNVERGAFLRLGARIRNKDNSYQWFHNDRLLDRETERNLNLNNIQKVDEGLYYCKVKNSAVPGLTLTTHPDRVVIPRTVIRSDSLALVALYNSTKGAKWRIAWDLKTPVASWLGLILDKPKGRITHLILNGNNLQGLITDSLSQLDALVYLDLNRNKLLGPIPQSILRLKGLKVLNLADNQLSYKIPEQLDQLPKLTELRLESNYLSGVIPRSISSLKNLKILNLSDNQLEGTLPVDVGALSQLEKLQLSNNKFTGFLPPSLGNLANLTHLNLASNQLNQAIPASLQQLSKLEYLDLGTNRLSGPIPPQLGNLVNLKYLSLASNSLTDSIPFRFGQLANLQVLRLDHNRLQDCPDWTSQLAALTDLKLAYNYLGPDDLKPNLAKFKHELARYSPQIIRDGRAYEIDWEDTFKIEVKVKGTANQYQWLIGERFLQGQNKSKLQLNAVPLEAKNLYHCRVTTSTMPGLLLFSLPDTLIVRNAPPQSIRLSSQKLYSDLSPDTLIAILSTQDPNLLDKHIYTLSGPDGRYFKIVNNRLVAGDYYFDFENKLNYQLKITSTDKSGRSISQNFILTYAPDSSAADTDTLDAEDNFDRAPEASDLGDLADDLEVINLNTVAPYPNPTEGFISFKNLADGLKCELQIINQRGQIIRLYTKTQAVYDLSDLAKGLYLVHLAVGTKTKILKIILH